MGTITKYTLIAIAMFVFILMGCSYSTKDIQVEYKIKSGRDLTFYIATDIHYLSESLTDKGEAFKKYVISGDGKQLEYMDEILDAFIYALNNKKPDVLIVSGDLTNNGEKKSHMDFAKKLKNIEKNGTPVYVIPGNHDISNPWARGFKGNKQYVVDSIKSKDFSQIYKEYGYTEAISRDKNTLSYLAAPSEDMWLLMLDTSKYKNNSNPGFPEREGEISQDTLQWIEKCCALAREKGVNLITVMHHNILDHCDVIQKGYILNNNGEAIDTFKANNMNLVLSGHIHIQDISSYKKDQYTIYDIVTSSLAVYPHNYGILEYCAQDADFSYRSLKVDVEGWSKAEGIMDKNLNNFNNYSEEFFGQIAFKRASEKLNMEESYSKEEIKLMSEVMKLLSLRFFFRNRIFKFKGSSKFEMF
jgi:3',5'-cyclic AMP phosphodiesterase CpdA